MKVNDQESPGGTLRRLNALRRQISRKQSQSSPTGVQVALKGYDTSTRHDEEHGENLCRNVLAKLAGSDPAKEQEYVIVGAHLDHIGMRGKYVYNGANDNASGSAVVLELARMLREADYRGKRTLVFCLWCGEERGLIGSNHYTKNPCGGAAMDRVVAYFNLDMVGAGTFLEAPGALNFPSIWQVICRDQDPELMKHIQPSVGGPGPSDFSGFIRQGIEALGLMSHGSEGHPDYHQPEDDWEKTDPQMLQLTGQFVLQGMRNLADETEVPLIIARRQQLYEGLHMKVACYHPKLEGSSWMQVDLQADTGEGLQQRIHDQVREMIAKSHSGSASAQQSSEGRATPAKRSITAAAFPP